MEPGRCELDGFEIGREAGIDPGLGEIASDQQLARLREALPEGYGDAVAAGGAREHAGWIHEHVTVSLLLLMMMLGARDVCGDVIDDDDDGEDEKVAAGQHDGGYNRAGDMMI